MGRLLAREVHNRFLKTAAAISEPLRAAIEQVGPIAVPPPTHASVAERLFVEIVNPQLSTKAALAIWTRVEPAALARTLAPSDLFAPGFEEALRSCGVSGNKVRALQAVREADERGLLGPDLAAMPHAERSAALCSIHGVGPWTADMVGISHFLDPDIWPIGDVAALSVLRRLTGQEDPDAVAAAFSPHRSILARYRWWSKDTAAA